MPRDLLVLDDDELVGAFIRRAAETLGFRTRSTTTPAAFESALAQQPPEEIVLDLQLGAHDGVEVLRLLAAAGCRARITLLSGFDPRVLASARELGEELGLNIGRTLSKPVHVADLRDALGAQPASAAPASAEALAEGIAGRELFLEFQPIVHCAKGEPGAPASLEALVRWRRTGGERIPPDRFIPVAEADPELMDALTMEIARQAAEAARILRLAGYSLPVAINVSAQNLRRLDFLERLCSVFEREGVAPSQVKLEVTETAAMTEPLVTLDLLLRFRLKGFSLAVDDFGTGYTSIALLRRLPYGELKIDRSFVAQMLVSEDARAVVAATVSLARSMGLASTAEGVETQEVFEALRQLGVTHAQGYFFSRPLQLPDLQGWLRQASDRRPADHPLASQRGA